MTNQELYEKLERLHLRTQYVRITLLTFHDIPVKEIQGMIQSGSMSVNGSSAVRRTINLSMLATAENNDIENIENDISINKKVKIEIGYDNPFRKSDEDKIVWFKCGIYILTSSSTSRSTSGYTISITGKDKMCMLDGTCGGTLTGALIAHEKYIEHPDKSKTVLYPTIFEIIFEAVNHWGEEDASKIIISDIDDKVRMLVRYEGIKPIYFSKNYTSLQFTEPKNKEDYITRYPGDDVGYKLTPFTYPGELVLKPGDTVVTLLDKIKDTLGNFEYFYDLDGNFVFQEIKNYLNDGSPLVELVTEGETKNVVDAVDSKNYVRNYNNAKFLYSLTDLDTTTQITRNPKWGDLKNDFCVWGERETVYGEKRAIRYHLVIDSKPIPSFSLLYMWEFRKKDTGEITRYDFSNSEETKPAPESGEDEPFLVGPPCNDRTNWREELYRQALYAQVTNGVYNNYYDAEMLAEWRKLFDPTNENWSTTDYWNPDVINNPKALDFWIDFIDDSGPLGKYSVREIGRRSKVVTNNSLKSVYNQQVPDVLFITPEQMVDSKYIEQLDTLGQKYMQLNEQTNELFNISTTGASCFDQIREMLYQNLSYNTTIQITCLPKYYMEPNNIIYIHDEASGIDGNYLVTQFTLPLAYNGTMSITATEVLNRV